MNAEQSFAPPDPLGIFLSDPESHLSDILYLYFRIYKKRILWRFMQTATTHMSLRPDETLCVADIGASMGFDTLFLMRKLTRNFRERLPWKVKLALVEGDQKLIDDGERLLQQTMPASQVDFKYFHVPLTEGIPLPERSQDIAICSEVVEHLEEPVKLLKEVYRILKPGGFAILTTDNNPNALHWLWRLPERIRGTYKAKYARPAKEAETVGCTSWKGREFPIYGHINLNPTTHWERLCREAGFSIKSFGSYESIRRGGGTKSPLALAGYFLMGAIVYYLMPKAMARFFGDTTALLLGRPALAE